MEPCGLLYGAMWLKPTPKTQKLSINDRVQFVHSRVRLNMIVREIYDGQWIFEVFHDF